MARTKSVRKGCNPIEQNRIAGVSGTGLKARIGSSAILLVWAAACMGASGPGIGLKVGAQTVEDPIDLGKTTRARIDLEVSSPLLGDEHVDFAFTVGGLSLGSFSDYYVDVVDDVIIEEYYDDRLNLLDVRLAARLYPLGDNSRIRPHIGAGIGYFWFLDDWDYEYAETFEDPLFPGTFYTIVEQYEGTDTVARGFFAFVTAGVSVPVGSNAELMFEFQYDYDKEDAGFDLGGPIYMFGARFRF
jgi:hypothetical protein